MTGNFYIHQKMILFQFLEEPALKRNYSIFNYQTAHPESCLKYIWYLKFKINNKNMKNENCGLTTSDSEPIKT